MGSQWSIWLFGCFWLQVSDASKNAKIRKMSILCKTKTQVGTVQSKFSISKRSSRTEILSSFLHCHQQSVGWTWACFLRGLNGYRDSKHRIVILVFKKIVHPLFKSKENLQKHSKQRTLPPNLVLLALIMSSIHSYNSTWSVDWFKLSRLHILGTEWGSPKAHGHLTPEPN